MMNANTSSRWLTTQPPDLQEVKQNLEKIVRDGRRASDVIDRIRAIVKKEPMRIDSLDLNEVIGEVLLLSRGELQRNRIPVETQLASELRPIPGDRIQLQQVLLNLILNGVEAMRETLAGHTQLVITSANDGSNGVLVSVRDFGKGLSADDLVHMFNAFYTSKSAGMGMA